MLAKNASILLCSVLFLWIGSAVEGAQNNQNNPNVNVTESSAAGFTVAVTFPQIELQTKTVNQESYNAIDMAGTNVLAEPGAPELPVWSELYAIPDGAQVNVTVTNQQSIFQQVSKDILPHQVLMDQPESQPEFSKQNSIYAQNANYPREEISLSQPMVLRDLNIVGLNINPVQYNPVKQTLKVTQSITIRVNFQGGTMPSLEKPVSEAFLPIYQEYVRNWKDFVSEGNVTRGTLLIVTPNAYESYLEPLVRWKMQEGFKVHVANTGETGTTTSSIKNYISNYYHNIDPDLEFVMLVGDISGSNSIPTYTYNSDVGDRQYGELDGNDYLPEVIVGRYSVSSSLELANLITKQVRYEKNPYDLASGWLTRALNVASYQHAYSILEIMRNVTHLMQAKQFTQVDSAYYPATSGGTAVTIIENAINDGVGFVNYRGWAGSSGWYEPSYHTSDLQSTDVHNGSYNGIMTSIVCGTGNFGTTECFGEAWLRVGTPSNPKGGVAFYGSTEFNQNVRYANIIDASFYYGAIRRGIRSMGTAVLFSKMAVYDGFPNNRNDGTNSGVEFYFHIYNMLGDPSLQMWVGNPRGVVAEFPTTVSTSAPSIPVRVYTTLFGNGVSNAHVTLLPANDENTIIRTITDRRGYTTLDVSSLPEGEYTLTITGTDMIPVSQNLVITEQAVGLSLNDWGIDDSPNGNGDGMWQPGETIQLSPTLQNVGSINSDTVTAELTVLHQDFSVIRDQVQYSPIDSGDTAEPLEPFMVQVNNDITDFNPADLRLEVTTSDTSQQYTFAYTGQLQRGMPAFSLESVSSDADNGIWQPAEIISLQMQVKNEGPGASQNVTGWVTSSNDEFTVLDNESAWGTLANGTSGDNAANKFRVKASANVIPGTIANLVLHIAPEGGTVQAIPFNLTVGNITVTDPVGPDKYGMYIFDNGDSDYSQAPEYNWEEIAPNLGGEGTNVPLQDFSENSDDNVQIDLPFAFKLYGVFYNSLTINSNGFLGMGANRWFAQRNWPIPGPLGAEGAMIAGYWDDLYLKSGSQVATYYDESNGRFIIEYSNMGNIIGSSGDTETFEIILYDPSITPTPTGDGEIVVQYKTVSEVPGYGGRDNASTVGIMNESHDVGIQYVYAQHYPAGAAQLGTGRAIKFTTNPGTAIAPPDFAEMNLDTLALVYTDTLMADRPITLENVGNQNLNYQIEVLPDSSSGWLSVNPANAIIATSGDQSVTISVDTTGLENAQWYYAMLHITSNAFNYDDITIPVELYFNHDLELGDIDLDGVLTAEDVALIQEQILGTRQMNVMQQMLADKDGDGVITVKDIVSILKEIDTN